MKYSKLLFVIILSIIALSFFVSAQKGFQVNSLLTKVTLTQEGSAERVLAITAEVSDKFDLEVVNVPGLTINETTFYMKSGEVKDIVLHLDSADLNPGVYVGALAITNSEETYYLPVIFEVESTDVFFDANLDIAPQYTQIVPGGKLVSQVTIFDLVSGGTSESLGATPVEINYYIYNTKGVLLSSDSESVVVSGKTQLTKAFTFPANAETGDYVLVSEVRYKSSVGTASQLFGVSSNSSNSISYWIDMKFIALVILILVCFAAAVLMFFYMIRHFARKSSDSKSKESKKEPKLQKSKPKKK